MLNFDTSQTCFLTPDPPSRLKEVANLLALICSVREMSIEQHLQAERAMLPDVFAFGHPNYSRDLTCQHVMLKNWEQENPGAWKELSNEGLWRAIFN